MTSAQEMFMIELSRASAKAQRFLSRRRLSSEDRDDIIGMAMLWCWEHREEFSLVTTTETWFVNAVRDAYRAWRRGERRQRAELVADIPSGDTTQGGAQALEAAEKLAAALTPADHAVAKLQAAGLTRGEMMTQGIAERQIRDARARFAQLRRLLPDEYEYRRVLRRSVPTVDKRPVSAIDQEIAQLEFAPPVGAECPPCWRCRWFEGWLPSDHMPTRMKIAEPEIAAAIFATEQEKIRIANEVRHGNL